jgi:hypothetical protein
MLAMRTDQIAKTKCRKSWLRHANATIKPMLATLLPMRANRP